jgi:REP element-mobilizing transposase RayT
MYEGEGRKLNRLPGYNYSSPGFYYVTINTGYFVEWFGEVKEAQMELNSYGQIALKFWQAIPEFYNNVDIDEFVIMPNHVHGIIEIKPPKS